MRTALLALAVVFLQTTADSPTEVDAAPQRFAISRTLTVPENVTGQVCAVLDAPVYGHTSGRLTSLRIYRFDAGGGAVEVPFALTESGEANQQQEPARVLNLGTKGSSIVFDLAMPQRLYTSVNLNLDAHNFIASAHVYGAASPGAAQTDLGTFALFDLASQGLSRSTTLPLQEVNFPILHVELTMHAAPGTPPDAPTVTPQIVTGAEVPPSREAQTLYTTVVQTSAITSKGRESVASVLAPAHVPIERTVLTIQPDFKKNFRREVKLAAYEGAKRAVATNIRQDVPEDETLSGAIQRVTLPATGFYPAIKDEQLTIETVLSANLRSDATVEFSVENQDDAPLPIAAIALQMRQRKLCFDADAGPMRRFTLLYNAPTPVRVPVYDYARLFRPADQAAVATLGAETANPLFVPLAATAAQRSYTDRHPELLWIVLLAVVAVLGTIAVRSAKRAGQG